MQIFVFPDTNVFLHFQFFDEVDWAAQFHTKKITLVLTQAVLSELDKHKWSGTRREKSRAQKVLKRLDVLNLSASPVELRPCVDVMALDNEPGDALFAQHRLSQQVPDDRLIASVLEFQKTVGGRCIVLTDDTGLRVKARGRGVEVVAPSEALRSEEEPDETERELEKAKRELAEARSAAPDLRLSFQSGASHVRLEWRPFREFEPATVSRLLQEWRDRHPRVTGQGDLLLPDGTKLRSSMFEAMPGYRSPEAAAERNQVIDNVYHKYESYLRAWPETLNALSRIVEFRLVLENRGTGPAEDVDVRLTTDAPGRWIEERPEVPALPEVPRERGRFDFLNSNFLRPRMPEISIPEIRRYDAPIDGPNISDDGSEVHWTVQRAKHLVPVALPGVYFQFNSTAQVASFNVNARLIAANIRKPRAAALHVEIALGDQREPPSPDAAANDETEDD